ncbi:MAG: class I tRNA ligase family protein, partial [Muribaculaceae bacterium]|nr:class I tRNA ligase family protein [Muribaculaceae bacterium]
MSKSLGNSPDPLDLIDKFGADGVRMGLMLAAPAGNDIMYDDKLCETGRNFCNKIWNAFRLVAGWESSDAVIRPEVSETAERWMRAQISATAAEVNDCFEKFRLNDALMAVYRLFRDDFSGTYLEMVKPGYQQPIDPKTLAATNRFFDELLRLLHPFMPFITEELWQHLADRRPGESIMYAPLPEAGEVDRRLLTDMELAREVVGAVRAVRAKKNISPKDELSLLVLGTMPDVAKSVVRKLANVGEIKENAEKDPAAVSFLVGTTEFGVPMASNLDVEAELARLRKELDYYTGFRASVMKKLGNERFVNNAPAAVVEVERRKLADAEQKLAAIEAGIAALQ